MCSLITNVRIRVCRQGGYTLECIGQLRRWGLLILELARDLEGKSPEFSGRQSVPLMILTTKWNECDMISLKTMNVRKLPSCDSLKCSTVCDFRRPSPSTTNVGLYGNPLRRSYKVIGPRIEAHVRSMNTTQRLR